MTSLGGMKPSEFELFAPNMEFAEALDAPENDGVPGRDPFPRIDRDGWLLRMEGESQIGTWEGMRVTRGLMRAGGTPQDWAVEDGQWLNEELASRGGVEIQLTDLRLVVVIPPTRANDQMRNRNPAYRRGEGGPVGLTITERLSVPVVASLSKGKGAVGRMISEMFGDFPPLACHLALENIAGVSIGAGPGPAVVEIRTQVDAGRFNEPLSLRLELALTGASAPEVRGLLEKAIRDRWSGAELPIGLRDHLASRARASASTSEEEFLPALFRPIGSSSALVSEWARHSNDCLPESIPFDELGMNTGSTAIVDSSTENCPSCGEGYGRDDRFCGVCGERLFESI